MLDYIIYFLLKYTYVLSSIIFMVKIYLFMRHKNKRWRFFEFLYFNEVNIKYTSTTSRARMKRTQNVLSIAILILLLVQLLSIALFG